MFSYEQGTLYMGYFLKHICDLQWVPHTRDAERIVHRTSGVALQLVRRDDHIVIKKIGRSKKTATFMPSELTLYRDTSLIKKRPPLRTLP